ATLPITVNNCAINGPGTFHNSAGVNTLLFNNCTVNSAIVNEGTLRVQRSATWAGAYTSSPGSILRIESEGGATSTLTTLGFTNRSMLELTTIQFGGGAGLTVSSGTLTNAPGDTILLSAGTGGSRTITGEVADSGVVAVNAPSTLAGAGAHHV